MKKNVVIKASKFLVSVSKGNIEQISSCLEQGANIYEEAAGYQCLHYAIATDSPNMIDVIKILIDAKSNINAVDKKGRTPLMHAVKKNNLPVTRILLDYKADTTIHDLQDEDVLMYAITSQASLDIIRLLINRGTNIDSSNFQGTTPLILASKYNNKAALELLIDRGANLFMEDKEHQSALYYAGINNNLEAVKVLLQGGALKTNQSANHNILSQLACNIGTYLQHSLKQNSKIPVDDFDKFTSFMNITNYFIVYGSNINAEVFTFLANYYSSTIYHLSTKDPIITLTATSNLLFRFLEHVQNREKIQKSHIDAALAIFKIFRLLKPTYIPKELESLRATMEHFGQECKLPYSLAFQQGPCNLTKNEKGNITLKEDAVLDLNILILYIKAELSKTSRIKDLFYNISEIDKLKINIDKLNTVEAYKDAFSQLLGQLNQTEQEAKIILRQKQLKYLIPSPTAQVVGVFELTSKAKSDKIKDPKIFFESDKEIKILKSEIQQSDNIIRFNLDLSLPHNESYHRHYNKICRRVLDQLQGLCKTNRVIDEEIHFPPPSNKYQFPMDIMDKTFSFLSCKEYLEIAIMGKQIFPELCSKIIEQYNDLNHITHEPQTFLEQQIQDLKICGNFAEK